MSNIIKVPSEHLKDLIQELVPYCKIVTLRAHTIPGMRKTNNPYFDKVYKDSTVNGEIHWNYSSAVNRQRIREELFPDFVAQPRKWGERLQDSPFVHYKGKYYIELKGERRLTEIYRDILTGDEILKEILDPFLTKPFDPSEYQGVNKGIHLRDYTLTNIREIRIGGNLYKVDIPNEASRMQDH